jgi:hypothetical protein
MILPAETVSALIAEFRKTIPSVRMTAAAIDHRESRLFILMCARREGYYEFAKKLEDAMCGRDQPPVDDEEPGEAALYG